jgi:hypothetical protein
MKDLMERIGSSYSESDSDLWVRRVPCFGGNVHSGTNATATTSSTEAVQPSYVCVPWRALLEKDWDSHPVPGSLDENDDSGWTGVLEGDLLEIMVRPRLAESFGSRSDSNISVDDGSSSSGGGAGADGSTDDGTPTDAKDAEIARLRAKIASLMAASRGGVGE